MTRMALISDEPMLRRFGPSLILNPGSVGAPVVERRTSNEDDYTPSWAEYALVEADGADLHVTLRRVPYALGKFAAAVRASGIPTPTSCSKAGGRSSRCPAIGGRRRRSQRP